MKEETTKADLYKAYSKGMDMMSGTPAFKAHQEKIKKMRKDLKMDEESNPRIPRKKGQPAGSKNTQTYIQMKILKELFMDLVSRTLLLLKHLSQRSGILLDRMLIKFKLLLLWNKGQEKWVKPLKQQSTENSSTQ